MYSSKFRNSSSEKDVNEVKGKVDKNTKRLDEVESEKQEKSAWNDMVRKGILLLTGAAASTAIPRILDLFK